MEFTSDAARQHWESVLAVAAGTVVALDFDGTLAPVVDDPSVAHIHPGAAAALTELAGVVRAVAVITGRPARQVIALGELDALGRELREHGCDLYVLGQYGNERWSSAEPRIVSPRPPAGLASFERELPAVLRRADAADAFVEEKGLAVAVHTRRMTDPAAAYDRLRGPVAELAERHRLAVEPGRNVLEVRSSSMDKGIALRTLLDELAADAVVFAGDDLGDVAAFEAVRDLRREGLPGVVVCSASEERPELAELADVVVDGPQGTVDLVHALVRAAP